MFKRIFSSSPLYYNVVWRLMLDVFSRGSFFFLNVLIARRLGVTEFGKFGYAVSVVQIFYIFTELGTHLQLIKEQGEKRGKNEKAWKDFFELKLALMGCCLILFIFLCTFIWHWENPWLLLVALFWMFGNSILDFNQFVCNGLGRMDLARRQLLIQRGFLIAIVLGTLSFIPTLKGVMVGMAVGAILGALVSNIYFYQVNDLHLSFSPDFKEWKRILLASIPNGIGGAFGSWYLRMGAVILAWLWSSRDVGEYSAAFRIYETTYLIPAGIMSVSVPHLAEALQEGPARFRKELLRLSGMVLPMALIWTLFLYFGSTQIIERLYGAGFAGAVPVLRVLAFVSGTVFVNYFVTHVMIVISRQRRHALHEAIVFLLNLVFSVYLIPDRASTGAAIALLLTELSLFTLTTGYLLIQWHSASRKPGYATINSR